MLNLKGKVALTAFLSTLLILTSCGDPDYEYITARVDKIDVIGPGKPNLSIPYIAVHFSSGEVRLFRDYHLDDFKEGQCYEVVIFKTPASRPVWVLWEISETSCPER